MNFDAIVVGAGPVGSTVAEHIAKEGYSVLILEEHPRIGIPRHCTGKISANALRELELGSSVGALQEVRGATFFSPDADSIHVERGDVQAYVFDRSTLDKRLSENAEDAGAQLLKSAHATNVSIDPNRVIVQFKHEDEYHRIGTRIVIGADGANSLIARRLGLYSKERSAVKVAIQRDLTGLRHIQSDFVELYLGKKYAPGFFAWIVPTGEDSAKVGLSVSPSNSKYLLRYLEDFISSHPIARKKLRATRCIGQTVHIIPTGGPLRRTVSNGVLIVGDAAGQVKSTTGGGVYYGMTCAKIAGSVVSKALSLQNSVLPASILMEYQERWRERFGREINLSVRIRHLLDSLTDDAVNYLFHIVRNDEALIETIEAEGDIDWQSKVSMSICKHALRFLLRYPHYLPSFLRYLIEYAAS